MSSQKIILLIFILCGLTYSQWYPQQAGTNYELKSVYFTTENTGYICGYNLVLKTTNGGLNWVNNFLYGKHQSITFTDENTGYLCSDSGKIYKTINSGNSWEIQSSGTYKYLYSISFANSNTGIAAGSENTIIKTTNGGNNWFSIASAVPVIDYFSIKMVTTESYIASGTNSYIVSTTDGGTSWIPFTMGEVNPLFAIEFINENTGYATGCCGMFLSTTNSGVNWSGNYYLSLGFTFHSLKFTDGITGYTCGDNGMMYRTTNGGMYWDSTVTGTDEILYSVYMVNNDTGWAVGNFGTILKTTNGGGTGYPIGIEQVSNKVPESFMLHQNYPNPFNPATVIKFSVPESNNRGNNYVKLIIFDVTGKEVASLVNEILMPGEYGITFNAGNLPSGIYYYMLENNAYRETRKMVLVK